MSVIRIENFEGALEHANPRLIPDNMGASARNVDFSMRRLEAGYSIEDPAQPPVNTDPLPYVFPDCAESITRSPVIDDEHNRYYFVCDFTLKHMSDNGERTVGVPAPLGTTTNHQVDNSGLFNAMTTTAEIPAANLGQAPDYRAAVDYAINNGMISPRSAAHVQVSDVAVSSTRGDMYWWVVGDGESLATGGAMVAGAKESTLVEAGVLVLDECGVPVRDPTKDEIFTLSDVNMNTAEAGYRSGGTGSWPSNVPRPAVLESDEVLFDEAFIVRRVSDVPKRVKQTDVDPEYLVQDYHSVTFSYPEYDSTMVEQERYYAFSFVTDMGEEGPLSVPVKIDANDSVFDGSIVRFDADASNKDYEGGTYALRVYRAYDGEWRYVQDDTFTGAGGMAIITDSKRDFELAEAAPNIDWEPPPRNIKGLLRHQSGSLATWKQNDLFFSVPYLPHAWHVENRVSIQDNIVSAKTTQNGIILLTNKAVYLVAGANPLSVQPMRVDAFTPCISRDSAVDMGEFVVFLSTDGLVMTDGYSVKPYARDGLPKSVFERVTTVKAARFGEQYVISLDGVTYVVSSNQAVTKVGDGVTGFDTDNDYEGALKIETLDGDRFLTMDRLGSFEWTSKRFRLSGSRGFSSAKIVGDVHLPGDGAGEFGIRGFISNESVYEFSQPVDFSTPLSQPILFDGARLPAGVYDEFEVYVKTDEGGGVIVDAIILGNSMREVRNG